MENRETVCLSSRVRVDLNLDRGSYLRSSLAALVVVAAVLGSGASCRADLVISAPNVPVAPGSSGSFDVLITSTGGTFNVASDTVELSLLGLSGVTFTGVSIDTVTPYIYGALSATTAGSTFTFSTFPGTQFETFDFILSTGATTIGPGDSFGLVNVQYSVAADALSGATRRHLTFGPDTSLADATGLPVAFTAQNGSITITTAVIPEPSSVALMAIGCASIVVSSARKRSARSKS